MGAKGVRIEREDRQDRPEGEGRGRKNEQEN